MFLSIFQQKQPQLICLPTFWFSQLTHPAWLGMVSCWNLKDTVKFVLTCLPAQICVLFPCLLYRKKCRPFRLSVIEFPILASSLAFPTVVMAYWSWKYWLLTISKRKNHPQNSLDRSESLLKYVLQELKSLPKFSLQEWFTGVITLTPVILTSLNLVSSWKLYKHRNEG